MDTALLDLPAPTAARLRRPGWRDPRLLAGVVLVAAAVALGAWAVRSAQETVPVYATRGVLVPGAAVGSDDLVVVEVRLPDLASAEYVSAARPLPEDAVALRTVGAGELVPADALGSAADVALRPVAVPVRSAPSDDVVPGAVVDVWFTPKPPMSSSGDGKEAKDDKGAFAPRTLAAGVTVAEVNRPDGTFAASGSAVVHVLVPQDALAPLLAALSADGAIDVLPVPGPAGR
ncbi:hypothetical protein [Cellulomonas palmilytica]|uniref:hypothetical protein n=1 Tax=Cellulomonas palmilytica TaxID=2608402 RepID=UPI001F34C7FC|nr:hypothetical protein [Cellulomonas palmilytica]UJP39504.1 hypothetical protein F1D97_14425 [Cellulomonas palmilytica]